MRIGVELLAQALDVRIDGAIVAHMLIAPYEREQVVAGEHATRRGGQRVEQLHLPTGERELVAVERHAQGGQVDGQRADDERLLSLFRGHAAQHRTDARHDLAGGEGLDDVVVRADVQAEDAVGILVARGDHEDGHARYAADAPADLHAVDAREHDVQQDQRGRGGVKERERLLAGARRQAGPALGLDILGQNLYNLFVVVHNENRIHGVGLLAGCAVTTYQFIL